MRFRVLLLALVLTAAVRSAAADEAKPIEPGPWKFGTNVGLNLAQSAFSSNWSGGDRGSIVWVLNSQSSAERQISKSFDWANQLNLAYGETEQQQTGTTAGELRWQSPDKTTDLLSLQSTGRWTLGGSADPYAAFSAESQFRDQTDPRGTIPLNPVKLKESAGLARVLFKTDSSQAVTRIGFALRQTLARAFTDTAGRDERSFSTNDGGIEWQTNVQQPLLRAKVLYKAQLLAYQPLFYSKANQLEQVDAALRAASPGRESISNFWKVVTVDFQNNFAAQITKSFGVSLAAEWTYEKFDEAALVDPTLAASADPATQAAYAAQVDKNVRKAGQFREVLALAFTYRLF
ncbi:MAG TPA: DUF3078 domain-containing protein [Candidatus Acidoferrales bacterium]|nr:DUF3078 domain-containing protein [Candidatus Acidoferrales bacterium]